jgi:phage terminase large subunit-like protein
MRGKAERAMPVAALYEQGRVRHVGAPFIKFRCTKRTGGDVVNFEAIKLLSFSAS